MESIKVAIQLHWFLWPPRYVKLVYSITQVKIRKSPCCSMQYDMNESQLAL